MSITGAVNCSPWTKNQSTATNVTDQWLDNKKLNTDTICCSKLLVSYDHFTYQANEEALRSLDQLVIDTFNDEFLTYFSIIEFHDKSIFWLYLPTSQASLVSQNDFHGLKNSLSLLMFALSNIHCPCSWSFTCRKKKVAMYYPHTFSIFTVVSYSHLSNFVPVLFIVLYSAFSRSFRPYDNVLHIARAAVSFREKIRSLSRKLQRCSCSRI